MSENPFRDLPSMTALLQTSALAEAAGRYPQPRIVRAAQSVLDQLRGKLRNGEHLDGKQHPDAVAGEVIALLERSDVPAIRPMINATGIIIHTNLGRSVLPDVAVEAARTAAGHYVNLELDLDTGKRSSRQKPLRELLCELTGAESATVVNNFAAATVISLRAIARGGEVIVSRGQLVEIGGGFRVPEIMAVSGAELREVGTTNITRLADYAAAITDRTAALMLVHQSNFRVRGFTESVELAELVELGRRHDLPVIDDCGSGAMIDFSRFGLPGEPVIPERIRAGADLVLFSGDKLLGGPQVGIILGRADLVERVERDPLMRAFRLDKMTLAALDATLRLYRDEETAVRMVPTLRAAIAAELKELRRRTEAFAARLEGFGARVREDTTYVGGGSVPDQEVPTVVIELRVEGMSEDRLAEKLRAGTPAVMARIKDGRVLLDLRTVMESEEALLLSVVNSISG